MTRLAIHAAPLAFLVILTTSVHAQLSRHTGVVDAIERAVVIEQVLSTLREFYVSEAAAQQMTADIRLREAADEYRRLTSAAQFVDRLTPDLRAVSGDKHLLVEF